MRKTTTVLAVLLGALGTAPAAGIAQGAGEPAMSEGTVAVGPGHPIASPHPAANAGSFSKGETISGSTRSASASAAMVASIGDYFFKPDSLTVKPGDTVVWTNDGEVPEGHTVTGDGFDSGVMETGATYSHTFSIAGTYDYLCTIHPGMKGTVTVLAASSDAGSGAGSGGGSGSDGSAAGNGVQSHVGGSSEGGGTDHGSGADASSVDGAGGGVAADTSTSGLQAAASSSSAGLDSSLPATGLRLLLLAEIGVVVLSSGLLVRELASWPRSDQTALDASGRTQ